MLSTTPPPRRPESLDFLSQLLRNVRLRGWIGEDLASPRLGRFASIEGRRHSCIVLQGHCGLKLKGCETVTKLAAGDLAVVVHGTGPRSSATIDVEANGRPAWQDDDALQASDRTGNRRLGGKGWSEAWSVVALSFDRRGTARLLLASPPPIHLWRE